MIRLKLKQVKASETRPIPGSKYNRFDGRVRIVVGVYRTLKAPREARRHRLSFLHPSTYHRGCDRKNEEAAKIPKDLTQKPRSEQRHFSGKEGNFFKKNPEDYLARSKNRIKAMVEARGGGGAAAPLRFKTCETFSTDATNFPHISLEIRAERRLGGAYEPQSPDLPGFTRNLSAFERRALAHAPPAQDAGTGKRKKAANTPTKRS